jgi:hypothetical protein
MHYYTLFCLLKVLSFFNNPEVATIVSKIIQNTRKDLNFEP